MNCINLRGRSLMARNFDRQVTETEVRVAVLNRYSALGTIRTVQVDLRGNTRPSPISPCMALASVVNRSRTLGCACPDMRTAGAGHAFYGAKGRHRSDTTAEKLGGAGSHSPRLRPSKTKPPASGTRAGLGPIISALQVDPSNAQVATVFVGGLAGPLLT